MSKRHEISSTGLIGFAIWIAACFAGMFWIAS